MLTLGPLKLERLGSMVIVHLADGQHELGRMTDDEWRFLEVVGKGQEAMLVELQRRDLELAKWRAWFTEAMPSWCQEAQSDDDRRTLCSQRMAALVRANASWHETAVKLAVEVDSARKELIELKERLAAFGRASSHGG